MLAPLLDCDLLESKDLGHVSEAQPMHVEWRLTSPKSHMLEGLHLGEELTISPGLAHIPPPPTHTLMHFQMHSSLLSFRMTGDVCHRLIILCFSISAA